MRSQTGRKKKRTRAARREAAGLGPYTEVIGKGDNAARDGGRHLWGFRLGARRLRRRRVAQVYTWHFLRWIESFSLLDYSLPFYQFESG